MRLTGRHAIVTGGGSGIGAAIARALAADGARLTLIGRRKQKLEAVARAIGGDAIACLAADVTVRAEVDAAFAAAREAHGPIEILVNNAGAAEGVPFAKLTPEVWHATIAVNLDAVFHCCQAALDDLLAAEAGRIVTIASTSSLKGYAYTAHYVAAKHGALGLTRALATEYAKTRLTVNAVCPGFTETEMTAGAIARIQARTGRDAADIAAELARFNPQQRMVQPEEVAAAALFLCLPESQSVNGQAIGVNGGETS
jgi:NAD(P)-dependent dehydrogenase (short-subunit alcohol dehydrogenase family)